MITLDIKTLLTPDELFNLSYKHVEKAMEKVVPIGTTRSEATQEALLFLWGRCNSDNFKNIDSQKNILKVVLPRLKSFVAKAKGDSGAFCISEGDRKNISKLIKWANKKYGEKELTLDMIDEASADLKMSKVTVKAAIQAFLCSTSISYEAFIAGDNNNNCEID